MIHVVAQLGAKRLTKLTPGDVERILSATAGTTDAAMWAMLTFGVPIFLVSRYAGHATIQTTVDQYGHLLPGDDESAQLIRETLDARFRGSG